MANKYTRSQRSDSDIKEIIKYTILNFGEQQADKYLDGLEETLQLLANSPSLGRPLTHPNKNDLPIKNNHHYYRYISHVIYYRRRGGDIFIVRILHKRMLPKNHL